MKITAVWDVTPYSLAKSYRLHLLACWFWRTYFFDPEDGSDMFLRNVGRNSKEYTASYPRRWYSSTSNPTYVLELYVLKMGPKSRNLDCYHLYVFFVTRM
jgi:hypothetical protein